MKNLIENSISWERLGRHPKSEYGFSIERAVMSKETGILTIDIRANFVMPYEDVLKIRAIGFPFIRIPVYFSGSLFSIL